MSNGIDDNKFALAPQLANLNHPDDVVGDEALSLEEKRALLASWASDSHAIPDAPTQRQLDNGAIVDLKQILRALRSLDDAGTANQMRGEAVHRGAGRHGAILMQWRKKQCSTTRKDDDDDPPPCPTSNVLPLPPRFVSAFGRLVA